MSSESLSGVVKISGKAFAPQKILSQFLAAVVQALGPGFLGHVKGIARFPDGTLYASTVGLPPEVNFQPFGHVPSSLSTMDFELTCVAIDLEKHQLRGAVEEAISASTDHHLIEGNFHDRTHQH
jgi:hypothetical protein